MQSQTPFAPLGYSHQLVQFVSTPPPFNFVNPSGEYGFVARAASLSRGQRWQGRRRHLIKKRQAARPQGVKAF
jgi:hypothetical protein